MSWSFYSIGKPADVKAQVQAMPYVPQPLKDMVASYADVMSRDPCVYMQVKSSGHFHAGDTYSNLSEFSINAAILAPPAPAAPIGAVEATAEVVAPQSGVEPNQDPRITNATQDGTSPTRHYTVLYNTNATQDPASYAKLPDTAMTEESTIVIPTVAPVVPVSSN